LVAAAGVAAACWVGRVVIALPRGPKRDRIDAFRVGQPWRQLVQDAQKAQGNFDNTVRGTQPGPLRDALTSVGERLAEGVRECWRIAQQGHALDGALKRLNVPNIEQELAQVQAERAQRGASPSLDATERAVQAQLGSAQRLATVATDARDRLRLLNAQLDEAVAQAVELAVKPSADLSPLTNQVEGIVGQLESLRQGLEEAGGASRASAS
jgi:DNA-binding FrmR family transcriptional regulator